MSTMNKAQITALSGTALLRQVFGMKPGQKLTEFVAEVKDLRENAGFIQEVRDYALKDAVDAAPASATEIAPAIAQG